MRDSNYEYTTTRNARKQEGIPPAGEGWEEVDEEFERFDFHEVRTWRRLRQVVPATVSDVSVSPIYVKHAEGSIYGWLTRAGLRQLLVDGGAVTIPEGVRHLGVGLSVGALATAELVNDEQWCMYQREKAKIWLETMGDVV